MEKLQVVSAPAPAPPGPGLNHREGARPRDALASGACWGAARAALAALRRPVAFPDARPPVCTAADLDTPKFGAWFNRPRRVLLTLAAVWVIAVFDLGYTLAESGTQDFFELNPLAARLLGGSMHSIIAYKFGLLGFGTLILLALRRHVITELACWFLFVSKLYVAVRWYSYFDCLLHDYVNPLVVGGQSP